jgi:PAS domain S-box-containing protein
VSHAVSINAVSTTGIAIVASMILVLAIATSWVDRRFATHALEVHKSNERYRQLFERSVAGVYLMAGDGRILDCNDACCRILGVASRTDFLFQAERDNGPSSADMHEVLEALKDRKVLTNFERCIRQTDDGPVWVLENATLLNSNNGDPTVIEGTLIDITERRKAEAELRQVNVILQARQLEIEAELRLAERVQQTLVPRNLTWGNSSIETFYQPARTIGGDFGLVVPGSDYLSIIVGDVSGHGIGSALVANRIYTEMIGQIQRGTELIPMLRHLNEFVLRSVGRSEHFCFTLAAARLKNGGRIVEFAGAGHPPAILVRSGEQPLLLESQSTVLGLIEEAVSNEATIEVPLQPGDRLVIYTDGFTESVNSRQEELGIAGLGEIAREASLWSLPAMTQHIVDRVAAFRSGPPADDMSLVVAGAS